MIILHFPASSKYSVEDVSRREWLNSSNLFLKASSFLEIKLTNEHVFIFKRMIFLTLALLAYKSFKSEWGTHLFLALSRVSHFSLFCFINSSRLDYKYQPSGICWQILKSLPAFWISDSFFPKTSKLLLSFHTTGCGKVFQQPLALVLSFSVFSPMVQIKYRGYANVMINHKTQGLDRNTGTSILPLQEDSELEKTQSL